MAKSKKPVKTSRPVKHEFGVGLAHPEDLTNRQVRSLAGSVGAHIQPRHKSAGKSRKR